MSNVKEKSLKLPHFEMAFSQLVYLGLSFHVVSSELVITVCQNAITSEYLNFCCVKILDCCVGIVDGKVLCEQLFFFQYFIADNFFSSFFCTSKFLMIFDTPLGNWLMVHPLERKKYVNFANFWLYHYERIGVLIKRLHNTNKRNLRSVPRNFQS